jgi:hypothetical protein
MPVLHAPQIGQDPQQVRLTPSRTVVGALPNGAIADLDAFV